MENSTLSGTNVETFNNLTAGDKYTNLAWTDGTTTVGTFDSVYINAANQYGGAGASGSNYAVESASVGGANHVEVSTLTLSTPSAYFGFWWSAGDPNNAVDFYSGSTLVAEFTTATLMDALPSTYNGNPISPTTLDPNEPFAFINFYATTGVTFDKIVFTDTQSSGFEADNYTVRTAAWGTQSGETGATPGVVLETVSGTTVTLASAIPEPDSALLLLIGLSAFLGMRRFKAVTVKSVFLAS
ncbi:MAG: PEP-CTERM sorting domain-containing protein [Methylococcales bacterium]|nr:PEP-CTERM sorting domain-containing protein [Methylococcales bacterium]